MEDFDIQEFDEIIDNIDQPSTPVGNSFNSSFLNCDVNNISPSMYTPKGTRFYHPFISNILSNVNRKLTSPDMFSMNRVYPKKDPNILSPDVAGTLFPTDINTNVDSQHLSEDKLYEKFQSFFDKKSAQFFAENNIRPSPDSHNNSGMDVSFQGSCEPTDSGDNASSDFMNYSSPFGFACQTPPSKFKWNRPKYQQPSASSRSSFLDTPKFIDQENAECAQKNDCAKNSFSLIDSLLLGQSLAMGESPTVFCRNRIVGACSSDNGDVNGCELRYIMRSSPGMKCNPLALNELNLSPICHNETNRDVMETDDESV